MLIGSLIGVSLPEEASTIPQVPCEVDDSEICFIAMTEVINPPMIFSLLDIDLDITWSEENEAWFAIVGTEAYVNCPPDSETKITECTADDVEEFIIVGGEDEEDGTLSWDIGTEKYHIITGGREGADIGDMQVLTTSVEISFDWKVELILVVISVTLVIGAGEMAFPIRKLFDKFRNK
ncbi:MAG: hypothetical protein HOE00_02880 [Euryarchaeota archaeon]|nr:hypothetical protein [Euryarchaeota archaeon]MBT3847436.1 hypothetical protein [Euryarchaeota archaeon]MBT4155846.1 hypothetical protein [Euryarchaeota archaeon]MBT4180526.1 hypothetical protein [Euryarchaeota archaeon]MBT4475825.1 hypothetical protein [Euryarchaeota archaeon]